jgi:hypothetical protein
MNFVPNQKIKKKELDENLLKLFKFIKLIINPDENEKNLKIENEKLIEYKNEFQKNKLVVLKNILNPLSFYLLQQYYECYYKNISNSELSYHSIWGERISNFINRSIFKSIQFVTDDNIILSRPLLLKYRKGFF